MCHLYNSVCNEIHGELVTVILVWWIKMNLYFFVVGF